MSRYQYFSGAALLILPMLVGCSTTYGHLVPASQFAYPNSNITPLGPTRAEVKKTTWMVPPNLKLADVKKCYNDALSKVEGANILINYKEDTKFTTFPLGLFTFYTVRYTLDGEAARQTIGQQELR